MFLLYKIKQKTSQNRAKIPLILTSEGLKCPPEVRIQPETCSTTCGTHFGPKKIDWDWQGGSGKVKIGQNIAQNGPCFWLWSPLEAPKWVKDPGNGLKSTRGSWGDHLGSISRVLDPFKGLLRAPKPKARPILSSILTYFDLP